MGRALVYGACMGALTGGPVFGAFFALAAVIAGPRMIADAVAVTVIGGVIGGIVGIVGLVGAVLPGMAVVIVGWKCAPARLALRWLRRICPCRPSRLGALSAP